MDYRFVRVSYTGRIKDGSVFDTTDEEIAKTENIHEAKRLYKSLPVVVGEAHLLKGLDEAVKGMKEGEEKEIELAPKDAYGERDAGLVRLVPIKIFKQQKVNPIPGMVIELDGRPAKIQTVSGGRVRVDFNSELAGKTLVYKIKIDEEAKGIEDQIKYLIDRSFNSSEGFEVKAKGKELELVVPDRAYKDRNILVRKASLIAEISRFFDFEKVVCTEVWDIKKKEDKTEEKAVAEEPAAEAEE